MDCNTTPDLMKSEENDLFYFESDHLALKGNKDYCEVLKTLVILSAIREKAIKDYSKVVEIRQKCLSDPFATIEKIQNGESLGVPQMMEIPKLPVINFEKINAKVYEADLRAIYSDGGEKIEESRVKEKNSKKEGAWTLEEQKKLEELLIIYPPEPIEMKRFQKIATALGNRSVQQVTSRVQKYFIKLYKAGLPIPGRIPKSVEKYKRTNLHRHQRYNHQYLWKPSTFFPDLYVPVTMDEHDAIPGPTTNSLPIASTSSSSQNYLLPTDYHQNSDRPLEKSIQPKNEAERQLQLLKRVKAEKLKEQENESVRLFRHYEYRCDYCESEPITGSRWHCMTCRESVDFCTDCILSQMYSSEPHSLHHVFGVFRGTGETPSVANSDSDSQTEASGPVYKNYESDSNYSGDLDHGNNIDDFNADNVLSDSNMELDQFTIDYEGKND